jgi:hypothetical protein
MFKGKAGEYFDGVGGAEPKEDAPKPKAEGKPMEEGGKHLTIHVQDKGGKLHSSIDKHDGYPADEMDHDSPDDAKAAHAQAMEEHFGEQPTEEAEEKIDPGIHKKVGNYLARTQMGQGE